MQVWNHFPLKKNLPYCKKTAAEALNIRRLHQFSIFNSIIPTANFLICVKTSRENFT